MRNDLSCRRDAPENGDSLAAKLRVWKFMESHAARYTMGESTSLPAETAEALLASAWYVWGMDREAGLSELPQEDLDAAYRREVYRLEQKKALGRRLWRRAMETLPSEASLPLLETMRSIGRGFARYDVHWFALEFPCTIDYPLCRPATERMQGIDALNEYLRGILMENDFLNRFPQPLRSALLACGCPDWKVLPVNLYEPVASGALGAVLTDCEPRLLAGNCAALPGLLAPLPRSRLEARMRLAARELADAVGLCDPPGRAYLCDMAAALCPRIQAAMDAGNPEGVFGSLRRERETGGRGSL